MPLCRNDDVLPLDEHAVGREQLDIEYATHVGGTMVVGTDDVSLIPKGVAYEVTSVVGVDIDLFLNLGKGRLLQRLTQVVKRTGMAGNGHEKEHKRKNGSVHHHVILVFDERKGRWFNYCFNLKEVSMLLISAEKA